MFSFHIHPLSEFLSTPSARRATELITNQEDTDAISIHALREEGDGFLRLAGCFRPDISIHALREEGDGCPWRNTAHSWNFYPRPPRGGRPDEHGCNGSSQNISIHALREEGDSIIASTRFR